MTDRIPKMRKDFALVAQALCWSLDDRSLASGVIKAAIDAGDSGRVALWADWLADLAESPRVRDALHHRCPHCAHYSEPRNSPGYCVERKDLTPAYDPDYPLRTLPADCGAACDQFLSR